MKHLRIALVLATVVIGGVLLNGSGDMASAQVSAGDDSQQVLSIDHYVRVRSTVPSIAGQTARIYVRERVKAGMALRPDGVADRVVLFVHGAGTPAEVAFDVPYEDYSWMGYLADSGFDVFSMDVTGYGRSTRPPAMEDPCNLSAEQQKIFIPTLLPSGCGPSYPQRATTIASDWDDIGAVVDYLRQLRRVERVSMVAWSLGGPRAGGYAARNPEKVNKLVLLAPGYNRTSAGTPPAVLPGEGAAMNTQSQKEFEANWNRQVGCSEQYERAVSDTVWSEMLKSDPVGATWGPGVRRAPQTTTWGWNTEVVSKSKTPTLMVAGIYDKQVLPERVRELYQDLGAQQKVLIDLGCSSHNAMWERNHHLLFQASRDWLQTGTVNGMQEGIVRLGY